MPCLDGMCGFENVNYCTTLSRSLSLFLPLVHVCKGGAQDGVKLKNLFNKIDFSNSFSPRATDWTSETLSSVNNIMHFENMGLKEW